MKIKVINLLVFLLVLNSCGDNSEELSGGYTYVSDGKIANYIFNGEKVIPCNIISFCYNENHILAIQKVQEEDCVESKNIIKKSTLGSLNYWIVDINSDKLFGPMSFEEFGAMKKKLNVSESLHLELPQ